MKGAPEKLPVHLAIIMDGNGRWAQSRGLPRLAGHREGVERVLDITRACRDLGIKYITLYAFSTENWKRPETEVGGLMELLAEFMVLHRQELVDSGTRLNPIGDLTRIPEATRAQIEQTVAVTASNIRHVLNIALNYGSRAEIVRAVRSLAADCAAGRIAPGAIDEAAVSARLYTAGQPDPDLLIRTSGEQRISNYLLWQLAYSEFIFSPLPWPEFTRERLIECLDQFGGRERRFGLTGDQVKGAK